MKEVLEALKHLNERWKYFSMDENGIWYIFPKKPTIEETCWWGVTNENISNLFNIPLADDWKDSLHSRNDGTWYKVEQLPELKLDDVVEVATVGIWAFRHVERLKDDGTLIYFYSGRSSRTTTSVFEAPRDEWRIPEGGVR